MKLSCTRIALCGFFLGAALTLPATGAMITFEGSSGDLAAATKFEVSGNSLVVTLTNKSPADVLIPADVLTAVFFDIKGAPSLAPGSAVLGPTSVVRFGVSDAGGVVGGEWAYVEGITAAPNGAAYGIGSAGFGIFGSTGRFPGSNLSGSIAVNGLQYGILSMGDNPATGNAPVTGSQPLIQFEVVFTLDGVPDGFNPKTDISNVFWQYGTSLSEPGFPEPGTLVLLAVGAAVLRGRDAALNPHLHGRAG